MSAVANDEAGHGTRALILALVALACGHMLSTLLRTIPALSLDLMAADFHVQPQALASLTSVYHFAFAASQIPVGQLEFVLETITTTAGKICLLRITGTTGFTVTMAMELSPM